MGTRWRSYSSRQHRQAAPSALAMSALSCAAALSLAREWSGYTYPAGKSSRAFPAKSVLLSAAERGTSRCLHVLLPTPSRPLLWPCSLLYMSLRLPTSPEQRFQLPVLDARPRAGRLLNTGVRGHLCQLYVCIPAQGCLGLDLAGLQRIPIIHSLVCLSSGTSRCYRYRCPWIEMGSSSGSVLPRWPLGLCFAHSLVSFSV